MSRLLYLCQLMPYPLDTGPKVRAYYVLRHLARKHQVTLLAFTRPDDPPEAAVHLREFCAEVHTVPIHRSLLRDAAVLARSLITARPFIIQRDHVAAMAHKVDQLLSTGRFDAVHADQLWMAQYALRSRDLPRILDEHNACYLIFRRLAEGEQNPLKRALLEREGRALARYEASTCCQFDYTVTVTEQDQRALKKEIAKVQQKGLDEQPAIRRTQAAARSTQLSVIPICIDPRSTPLIEPSPQVRDVLHLGTMFFLPNVEGVLWFTREVWPQVAAQVPEATFTIVGKNPPLAIQRLASPASAAQPINSANSHVEQAIRITGYVADPAAYVRKAGAFIVPLHSGGGMRVKILNAWCWGLPIVSTSLGAEGIACRDGENILLADDAPSFAQAVVRVLRDSELARQLRENGRRWVEEYYDWNKVYSAWDQIYSEAPYA